MLARLKFEISGLVKEMLDQVDQSVFQSSDSTFLDPTMGGGQFIFETIKRLKDQGHSNANIKSRVFGYESNILYVNYVKELYFRLFGEEIPATLLVGGLDELEALMKRFDLVMGNPPYQENTDSDKGNKQGSFWMKFVLKGFSLLKEDGKVIMIHPITWTGVGSYGTKSFKLDLFKQMNPSVLNFTCSNYFDVGIDIGYSILNKSMISETLIETQDDSLSVNLQDIKVLPFLVSRKNISIVNKIIDKNNGKLYPFSEGDGKNCGLKKVYILKARFTDKIYIDETGSTKDTWKCSMPLSDTMIGAHSVFQSKLVNYFFTIMGGKSGLSQTGILQNLPNVDLTRTWTDQELYTHFNLTDEEIEYIEEQMK